jgi:hypothetical protein
MYVPRPSQSVLWISSDSLSRSVGLWRSIYLSLPLFLYYGDLYVGMFIYVNPIDINMFVCPDLSVLWRSICLSVHICLSMEIVCLCLNFCLPSDDSDVFYVQICQSYGYKSVYLSGSACPMEISICLSIRICLSY